MSRLMAWTHAATGLFFRNNLTLLGTSITTASGVAIAGFIVVGALGLVDSPYTGILAFMVLPALFILGLLLIPAGILYDKFKREPAGGRPMPIKFDLASANFRRAFAIVGVLTCANLFIISSVSYQGVGYMESDEFCGQVCHSVMDPEYTAYLDSPHAHVGCVECHIGPGVSAFVNAKLSGVRQVISVNLDTYETPIPAPVHSMRPAAEICEECHWREREIGDTLYVRNRYEEDEANTKYTTVLTMKVGGGQSGTGMHGWHNDPNKKVTYYSPDEKREEIPFVRVEHADGRVVEYMMDGAEVDTASLAPEDMRTMDCMDCHNRPAHIFHMPDRAMDAKIEAGEVSTDLPYIKQVAVEALNQSVDPEGGSNSIASHIREFYQENHADVSDARGQDIDTAIAAVQDVYTRNIFPNMEIGWGTYPRHVGHTESVGCFRCHDDSHTAETGEVISQDCTICHNVIAWDEEDPEIISQLMP